MHSLRTRLLAAFLAPAALLFCAVGAAGYLIARDLLEDELGKSLERVAAATASQVSAERLLSIVPGDEAGEGTRTFRNLQALLAELRQSTGMRRVFAVDAQGRVRIDVGGGLPVGAEVPELARDRLELTRVFAGEPAASQVLFAGDDGELYKTGYAPVRRDGEVVGAVGVEGSARFYRPLRALARAYAVLTVGALVALALLAVATARGVARPLRRLMEAALRIGRGDLSTQVAPEPTLEVGVLARELEQMRRSLEGRDRQLKMMLAGIAHEVRNPMGGIELFAGLAREELAGGEVATARSHVERIQGELGHLKRVVEEFLAFAREERLHPFPCHAADLLEQVRALMQPEAERRGVRLVLEADVGTLEVDVGLLTAALVNLAHNALCASPREGTVRLSGRKAGDRYAFEVADQGPGISDEVTERIFEPFFTTREKGTGLGLPLARKIAQAHGGELALVNAKPSAVFRLSVPLKAAAAAPPRG